MSKLLRAELSRRLFSVIYISEIIFLLIYNFLEIAGSRYGFQVDIPYFLFNKTSLICLCAVVNVSLKVMQEFDNRTINNKLFCGYNKSKFYNVEVLVGIIEGLLLFLIDTISVFIIGIFQKYSFNISYIDFAVNFMIICTIISMVIVISTVLSVLFNHNIFSIFIIVGLSVLLMYGGNETVHTLNQPKETTLFSTDGEIRDNPLYVDGFERKVLNTHLFLSPYAQSDYVPYLLDEEAENKFNNSLLMKNSAYHWEFMLVDISGGLVLYFIGRYLFEKQNLQ